MIFQNILLNLFKPFRFKSKQMSKKGAHLTLPKVRNLTPSHAVLLVRVDWQRLPVDWQLQVIFNLKFTSPPGHYPSSSDPSPAQLSRIAVAVAPSRSRRARVARAH